MIKLKEKFKTAVFMEVQPCSQQFSDVSEKTVAFTFRKIQFPRLYPEGGGIRLLRNFPPAIWFHISQDSNSIRPAKRTSNLTNQQTSWSTAFLEKLIVPQIFKNFLHFMNPGCPLP
jgi:hypothetical protein